MKLKLLFFPAMLITSVSFFIGFTLPEIKKAKLLYDDNKKTMQELENVEKIRDNISNLDQNLGANKGEEEFINKYVPKTRVEEKIIDMVNLFSYEGNVLLVDLKLMDKESPVIEVRNDRSETGSIGSNVFAQNDPNRITESIVREKTNKQKAKVVLQVIGRYEDIKEYVRLINKSDMINDVDSVSIISSLSENNNTSEVEENSSSELESLTAEIVVDFYYFKNISWKGDYNNELFKQKELDFSKLQVIREFIAKKMPELVGPQGGKVNPFL